MDARRSHDPDNEDVGGIVESEDAKQNIFRRNLFDSGFETNLLVRTVCRCLNVTECHP